MRRLALLLSAALVTWGAGSAPADLPSTTAVTPQVLLAPVPGVDNCCVISDYM